MIMSKINVWLWSTRKHPSVTLSGFDYLDPLSGTTCKFYFFSACIIMYHSNYTASVNAGPNDVTH